MKPTLTDISSIFVDGRSGESMKLDAACLDAMLVPRSEGQDQDIGDYESDHISLRSNGYRSWNHITIMNERVGLSSDRGYESNSFTGSKEKSDNARW